MTLTPEIASKGKVLRIHPDGASLVFHPNDTSYEHHLDLGGAAFDGPLDRNVAGVIRVRARKVYTVPNGGNFVQPIIGSPRIIQGRVISLDERSIVVKAGATFLVELPTGKDSVDLNTSDIFVNARVNVVAWPGAAFEWVRGK